MPAELGTILRIVLMLLACLAVVPVQPASALPSGGPESPRCNARVASQLEDRVRELQKHPPGEADWDARFDALRQLVAEETQEANVLESACAQDRDLSPIEADLRASEARAYMLQSDVTLLKYQKSCPDAAPSVASGFLAAAWRALALATPDEGPASQSVTAMSSEVESRAALLKLALPPVRDTSNYWLTTTQKTGEEAAARCPG